MSTELVDVLVSVRELLARPENDYSWSSWEDQTAAMEEIDEIIADVRKGHIPKTTLDVLFAPTGPIQEVSLSSGWAKEFLTIADRYDTAITRAGRPWWKFW